MKMRKVHAVPLSDQVVVYLRELQQFSGPEGYVFPAFHTTRRPMSENTMNQAFRRMGYTSDEVTAHGLRTTASTMLNQSGKWHPDAIERALAHGDSDAVRGIYNRGEYWDERVKMMQWWSDYLDRLRKGGDIVDFRGPASRRHPLKPRNPTALDAATSHDLRRRLHATLDSILNLREAQNESQLSAMLPALTYPPGEGRLVRRGFARS